MVIVGTRIEVEGAVIGKVAALHDVLNLAFQLLHVLLVIRVAICTHAHHAVTSMDASLGAEIVELMGLVTSDCHASRMRSQGSLVEPVTCELDTTELCGEADRLRSGWESLVIEKCQYALLTHEHLYNSLALLLRHCLLAATLLLLLGTFALTNSRELLLFVLVLLFEDL